MDSLLYKPDWADAKRRWSAFWVGERLERPCMLVTAPRAGGLPAPSAPTDPRSRWTDVDYLIALHEARHSSVWHLGESVPHAFDLLAAWCAAYGARTELRPDTIWIGRRFTSWEDAPDWERDWDDDGWRMLKRIVQQVVEHARGRYFVGMPPMLVPNDLLASLRGTDDLLVDFIEEPEAVEHALAGMRAGFHRMYTELAEIMDSRTLGYGNWWPFWSPEPFYAAQSDLSCMLSPAMFERFIVPELEELCRPWRNVFYHLDGPGALHHLDRLLRLDCISGIQWVPGAGRPGDWRTWRWLHEKVAAAGKRVWIGCRPSEVEEVIHAFPPERLLLSVGVGSREEGERLLQAAARWTAGRVS